MSKIPDLMKDMVPRLLTFEEQMELCNLGLQGKEPDSFQVMAHELRRQVQDLRSKAAHHMSEAARAESRARILAHLHDSLGACYTCAGSGKVSETDMHERKVYAVTCEKCGGSGRKA